MGTSLHNNSIMEKGKLVEDMLQTTAKAVGAENLINILKNYARV